MLDWHARGISMKARSILLLLLLLLSTVASIASPQIPDILIYNGKQYEIRFGFLDEYFKTFPKRKPKAKGPWCSGLHRGYQATFEVVNENVLLKDVRINICSGLPVISVLKKVVPDGKQLFIDWASDLMVSGYGENLEDPYAGDEPFNSAYENYTLFEIDKGNVVEVRHFDNKGFRLLKTKQFEAFKKTADYDVALKRTLARDSKMSKSKADESIERWVFSYTKKFLIE